MNEPAAPPSRPLHWLARMRRHPSALLLLVQLVEIVAYPLLERTGVAQLMLGVFGVVVLLLALRLIRFTAGRVEFGIVLAVIWVVLGALWAGFGLDALQPWQAGVSAVFYFYATWCLIAYMLADRRATSDELFAASATFTLLAWGFTHVLVLCQILQPGAFSAAGALEPRSWSELMFLSFALLSSTGIGDILPMTALARAVAALEMFAGVMYLALVVSRLVGLAVRQRSS